MPALLVPRRPFGVSPLSPLPPGHRGVQAPTPSAKHGYGDRENERRPATFCLPQRAIRPLRRGCRDR
eukprot:401713-Lingulodinium_polyedra.AAC.1